MLCEKCHTATDAGDAACKNCGSSVKKLNRSWSRIARVSVVLLVVAVFAAYFLLRHFDMLDFGFFDNLFGTTAATADEPAPGESSEPAPTGEPPQAADDTEAEPPRRSDEEHQAVLDAVLFSTEAYIRNRSHNHAFISVSGYLFNYSDAEFPDIGRLAALNYIPLSFADEDVLILYLRPADLLVFDEVELDVPHGERNNMTVFLAYETPIGLGLYSRHGRSVIFREHLIQVMADYRPYNGEIRLLTMDDALYRTVLDMIANYHGADEVFIRHLAVDEAHGLVAFTTPANPALIRNIIFSVPRYEEDAPAALTTAPFEAAAMPVVAINSAVPGFNFGLLPRYNYAAGTMAFLAEDGNLFIELLDELSRLGFEEPQFVSASWPFAYVVSAEGLSFIGIHDWEVGWQIGPVDGWREAKDIITEYAGISPYYIIWQR